MITASAAYARKRRKIRDIEYRAARLENYAQAVMGMSDLKVGPCSIAELLRETAAFLLKNKPR